MINYYLDKQHIHNFKKESKCEMFSYAVRRKYVNSFFCTLQQIQTRQSQYDKVSYDSMQTEDMYQKRDAGRQAQRDTKKGWHL